ncbi:hypothetical protein LXL04_030127 [Taraxacum kok-saghyz]
MCLSLSTICSLLCPKSKHETGRPVHRLRLDRQRPHASPPPRHSDSDNHTTPMTAASPVLLLSRLNSHRPPLSDNFAWISVQLEEEWSYFCKHRILKHLGSSTHEEEIVWSHISNFFQLAKESPQTLVPALSCITVKHSAASFVTASALRSEPNLEVSRVNHLVSGKDMDLPMPVTDEQSKIILFPKSSFILGRSGTGKTTVLAMKMYQKEQLARQEEEAVNDAEVVDEGFYEEEEEEEAVNDAEVVDDDDHNDIKPVVLRQLFVTASSKDGVGQPHLLQKRREKETSICRPCNGERWRWTA